MKLDSMEPAIEMINEIMFLEKLIKTRVMDKLICDNALQMLSADEAIRFLLDTDNHIKNMADDLTAANDLLVDHLDHFIDTDLMMAELQKY